MLDAGISYTYQGVSLEEHQQALSQALAVIKVVSQPTATRESIVAAASAGVLRPGTFEKDGYLWVGLLGLKFNQSGQLVEAVPSWSP